MYPIMTLSSFEAELYRSAVALKGHLLGHALSSFQRSLSLQPNPDLDAPDSSQLPSGDVLSSQGNGDFTSSHSPCQARQSLMRLATFSCLRRRLFPVAAASTVKRERHWMRQSRRRCLWFRGEPGRRFRPMKQPLPLTKC